MTMQAVAPSNPDIVVAQPDLNIRKGIGFGEDGGRTIVSYAQYEAAMKTPNGPAQVRKWAIVMRGPAIDKAGRMVQPGGGEAVAMPAEKYIKWFGQGYRPTNGVEDHSLYVFPAPPTPISWLPSMVEEAIANGEAIPAELAPAGYSGPVFETRRMVVEGPGAAAAAPDIFRCDADGCPRFFDSPQGLGRHKQEHKDSSESKPD
jgi:hypothetical protein